MLADAHISSLGYLWWEKQLLQTTGPYRQWNPTLEPPRYKCGHLLVPAIKKKKKIFDKIDKRPPLPFTQIMDN